VLLRLPFLFVGALGLPVLLALAIALGLGQWRTGEHVDSIMLPTGAISAGLIAWLWLARRSTEPHARGLLALSARAAPWLSIPGAVIGLGLGIKVHIDYVERQENERTDLARRVCFDLKMDAERCVDAARACLPRPLPISKNSEQQRACVESRLR
jgi:hypothetical protein